MLPAHYDTRPWYWTATPEPATRPVLQGREHADVCVIGAGIAGCSAALHLQRAGYRVIVLEQQRVGWGASGRSGAQAIFGFAAAQDRLESLLGHAEARALWEISLEALALQRRLIDELQIHCDYVPGHLHVAVKPRQVQELAQWQEQLQSTYNYRSLTYLTQPALREQVDSQRYLAGLHDSNSGHLNPLEYVRGLASGTERFGGRIFERTKALQYTPQAQGVSVKTEEGEVQCRHLLLAGNAYLGTLAPTLARRIIGVGTYIVATEALGEDRARALLPQNAAVADLNWVLDYFRRTSDHRLLFGGRVSYSGLDPFGTARATRARMIRVFPQLADARITHAWGGYVDITMNRAPDFGRLGRDVYYLQGFSGHGIALAGMAGQLVAEAIAGTTQRFDLFCRIPHRVFPGGALLRRPALMLAMLWYRMRDLL